jgi:nicotinate-nucleotide--dimethylbenzimidazole phosphoribosyltransferase
MLDRAVDKVLALGAAQAVVDRGTLVLVGADHPVTSLGVSAYDRSVTRSVAEAAVCGLSVGAVAARGAGLALLVVDAGIDGAGALAGARSIRPAMACGDLVHADALSKSDTERLVSGGADLAGALAADGPCLFALGEVGVGNTTVAAALAAALLGLPPEEVVGLGAGSDSALVANKRSVVDSALARLRDVYGIEPDPMTVLGAVGGPEFAVMAGLIVGAASRGAVVVLDGMATCVAALVALEMEPAVAAHLIAGQRSREVGHRVVLERLGLEPLIDLRFRAGEGAGAAMATTLLRAGLTIRLTAARTAD